MAEEMKKTAYKDDRYALGEIDGMPYLVADGTRYQLTCHPYEPCLYITEEDGTKTAVHNSFDPRSVLYALRKGELLTSITGREYDALDFCRMVEYAAGLYNIQIDDAEKVFGGRPKKKHPEPPKEQKKQTSKANETPTYVPNDRIIEDEQVETMLAAYPDLAVDYCIVRNEDGRGYNAHWFALLWAARKLFIDEEDDEAGWHFDVAKAEGKPLPAEKFFGLPEAADATRVRQVTDGGSRPYWQAFLLPPTGSVYTADDFRKVNGALFPNGTDGLEVYEWTTGWSDYFDEGREWWGTLCATVYDRSLDRFVVIMASATD